MNIVVLVRHSCRFSSGASCLQDNSRFLNAWLLGFQKMLYAPVGLSHLGKATKERGHLGQALVLTHDIGLVLLYSSCILAGTIFSRAVQLA